LSHPLDAAALSAALAELPTWRVDNDALVRTYRFADFATAMRFIAACVPDIDALDHHPTWSNTFDQVVVRLCTHDAGNRVTELDVKLAKMMELRAGEIGTT
jgi:4a-hydroxytetrahydrobiopterin dehydratase